MHFSYTLRPRYIAVDFDFPDDLVEEIINTVYDTQGLEAIDEETLCAYLAQWIKDFTWSTYSVDDPILEKYSKFIETDHSDPDMETDYDISDIEVYSQYFPIQKATIRTINRILKKYVKEHGNAFTSR